MKQMLDKLKHMRYDVKRNHKQGNKKMKVSKKNQASKAVSWVVVSTLSVIILGFASRGVSEYIDGMSEEQKLLAAVFVVTLVSYIIYTHLKKVIK